MNIETGSENVRTMGEAVKSTAVPGKHTEGYVDAGVISEGASGADKLFLGKILILLKIWMQNQVFFLK